MTDTGHALVAAAVAVVVAGAGAVYLAVVVAVVVRRWRRKVRRWQRHVNRVRRTLRGPRARPERSRPDRPTGDRYRCPASNWAGGPWACRWCNGLLPRGKQTWCGPACRHTWEENHVWAEARAACLRRDGYRCTACGTTDDPQVNHIVPVLGRHSETGCHHHLAGLHVLCGPAGNGCHQAETNRQRAAGLFDRGAA